MRKCSTTAADTGPGTTSHNVSSASFEPIESVLSVFSTFTKSSQLHLYVLPVALAFDVRLFAVLTFVTSIAGYATSVLKWVLADARPYWWVKQPGSYSSLTRPDLRQTELTCETSAGNPSGHLLLNAACWYVFVHYALRLLRQRQVQQQLRGSTSNIIRWLRPLCWTLYAAGLCMVAISRMYFGCHFLHQCVLGAALGWSLCHGLVQAGNGRAMHRLLNTARLRLAVYFAAMVAVALAVYFGQIAIGVDPQWSVHAAFNHCKDPLFVRPETTAVYSLVRDLGVFFGLVLLGPLSQ